MRVICTNIEEGRIDMPRPEVGRFYTVVRRGTWFIDDVGWVNSYSILELNDKYNRYWYPASYFSQVGGIPYIIYKAIKTIKKLIAHA
jgi:hypothetical protein